MGVNTGKYRTRLGVNIELDWESIQVKSCPDWYWYWYCITELNSSNTSSTITRGNEHRYRLLYLDWYWLILILILSCIWIDIDWITITRVNEHRYRLSCIWIDIGSSSCVNLEFCWIELYLVRQIPESTDWAEYGLILATVFVWTLSS